jgi:hypothetical protein
LTTNFDSLIEQAMRAEELDPVIVRRADDVAGLPPLSHLSPCVVKIHGDYQDYRTLNTSEELAAYPEPLDQFLRRVLGDYGLVVCGWSGEHDHALVELVRECRPRNFGTYWAHRGALAGIAREIVAARSGKAIQIANADEFLGDFADGVESLERTSARVENSSDLMIAILKRNLQDPNRWIDLDEAVSSTVTTTASLLQGDRFRYDRETFNKENVAARVLEYESIVAPVNRVLLVGAYWGRTDQDELWLRSMKRLIRDNTLASGNTGWIDLADYPPLLAFYSLGLGALSAARIGLVVRALRGGPVRFNPTDEGPWILRLHPWFALTDWFRALPGLEKHRQPISERIWQVLEPFCSEIAVTTQEFERIFDEWEMALSLESAHQRLLMSEDPRTPVGRFSWKYFNEGQRSVVERFRKAISEQGRDWPYLKYGLCGGDPDRAAKLVESISKQQELGRFGRS